MERNTFFYHGRQRTNPRISRICAQATCSIQGEAVGALQLRAGGEGMGGGARPRGHLAPVTGKVFQQHASSAQVAVHETRLIPVPQAAAQPHPVEAADYARDIRAVLRQKVRNAAAMMNRRFCLHSMTLPPRPRAPSLTRIDAEEFPTKHTMHTKNQPDRHQSGVQAHSPKDAFPLRTISAQKLFFSCASSVGWVPLIAWIRLRVAAPAALKR